MLMLGLIKRKLDAILIIFVTVKQLRHFPATWLVHWTCYFLPKKKKKKMLRARFKHVLQWWTCFLLPRNFQLQLDQGVVFSKNTEPSNFKIDIQMKRLFKISILQKNWFWPKLDLLCFAKTGQYSPLRREIIVHRQTASLIT